MTVPNLTAPELPEAFALGAALLSPNALKVVARHRAHPARHARP